MIKADDLERLAEALGEHYAMMAYVGATLGLRWGEVAGLRVGHIDLLDARVSIVEQITRGECGRHVTGPPKSKMGQRTIAAPQGLVEMLSAHLARRGLTGADAGALVFVSVEGGPLRYDRWRRRVWIPAVARANLPGLTFHDLRRANATTMVINNIDVNTAQVRLGHSDPRLTLGVYAQASSDADRAAAETLGSVLLPSTAPTRVMSPDEWLGT